MKNIRGNRGKFIWLLSGILFITAAALLAAARKVPGFAEWYSEIIYPVLVGSMGRIFGWFPFSVVEMGLYAGIVWLIGTLVKNLRKPAVILRNYALTIAVLLFLYAACCSVNYYRVPFSTYYMQSVRDEQAGKAVQTELNITTDTLIEMCHWLTEKVNEA